VPYNIDKKKCKQSDGDAGTHVLSYTDGKGKDHDNCHTSKKGAQGQIAAIEGDNLAETDDMVFGGGGDPEAEGEANEDGEGFSEALIREYIREKLLNEQTFRGKLSQKAAADRIKELGQNISGLSGDIERVVFTSKGVRLHTKDLHKSENQTAQGPLAAQLVAAFVNSLSDPPGNITPAQVTVESGDFDEVSRSYMAHKTSFPDPEKPTGAPMKLNVVFASQAAGGRRGGGYGYEAKLVSALGSMNYSPDTADVKNVDIFIRYIDENAGEITAAIEAKKQNAKFGEPTVRYSYKSPVGFYAPPGARSAVNTAATTALLNTKKSRDALSPFMKDIRSAYLAAVKEYNTSNPKKKQQGGMTKLSRIPMEIYDIMVARKAQSPPPPNSQFVTGKSVQSEVGAIVKYYVEKAAHYIQIEGKGLYFFALPEGGGATDPLDIQGMLAKNGRSPLPNFSQQGALSKATTTVEASLATSSGKVIRAVGKMTMKDIPESSFSLDKKEDVAMLAEWLESKTKTAVETDKITKDEVPEISIIMQGLLRQGTAMTERELRLRVRLSLLKEDLSRADRTEISRIFKKEMEKSKIAKKIIKQEIDAQKKATQAMVDKSFKKNFDKELRAALGASFFGTPGKINKFVIDEIQAEVQKMLGDKATKEIVVQICKDVIIKLYRELSFSYPQVIQRIKV